jgi:septum site-determining protein MinD
VAKIIVVTSGKGGVGKTTSSASFASGLALRGHKTAVLDFDVGLRNLDLIMGCERRVVYDLINVINKEATLNQALIKDKHCENLFVLPASQTRDKDALTEEGVERVLNDLAGMDFEYIICDSPAGIERGAVMALTFADEAIIVTNPEVSSVRDSDRILGIIQAKSRRAQNGGEPVKEHLLITRYVPKRVEAGEMLSHTDVQEILRIPLIGIIPESESVLHASNQGNPAIHIEGRCRASSEKRFRCALRLMKSPACFSEFSEASKMALLSFLFNTKPKSANAAKERLQIIIARERNGHAGPDFLPALHKELIAVISKYTRVNAEDIKISLDRQGNLEVLDVNVVLPDAVSGK